MSAEQLTLDFSGRINGHVAVTVYKHCLRRKCTNRFPQIVRPGRPQLFCSDACRQAYGHARRRSPDKLAKRMYATPPEAVEALLQHEEIPASVWEPCCGTCAIVKVLRAHGCHVVATDLIDYAVPEQDAMGRDFLREPAVPEGVQAIVTNPPFEVAEKFVEHALRLCPVVIMLLPLSWLESQRRAHLLESGQLARVHVFARRLPMMHRQGHARRKTSNMRAYAWFVWDRAHQGGAPTVHRISWR